MQLLSDENKDSMRLAWLSTLEALYTFAPWQRVILVFGLVMIIPAYWIFRVGTRSLYDYNYKSYELVAKPAFTDPKAAQVGAVSMLPVGGGGYSAYAKVSNPNLKLSGTQAVYTARFFNSGNKQVYQTSGQFYLAPGKDTYIVVPRFQSTEVPTRGEVEVGNVRWQQKFQVPEISLSTPAPILFAENGGTRLEGIVVNNSPYKLGAVHIVVFLYDSAHKVIAVSDRSEFTLLPRERRAYVLHFSGVTPDQVAKAEPTPETNAADVSNIQSLDGRLQLQNIKPSK